MKNNISIHLLKNYKFIQVRMKNIDLEISLDERKSETLISEKEQLEKEQDEGTDDAPGSEEKHG